MRAVGQAAGRLVIRLHALEAVLASEIEPEYIWAYFQDEVASSPYFAAVGHRASHALLESEVAAVATRLAEAEVRAFDPQLIAEVGLWHGACTGFDALGSFLYMPSVGRGVVAITRRSGVTLFDDLVFADLDGVPLRCFAGSA